MEIMWDISFIPEPLAKLWCPQNNDWFNSNDLNNRNHGKFFSSFSFHFFLFSQ